MVDRSCHAMSPLIFIFLLFGLLLNPVISKQSFESSRKSTSMKLTNDLHKINKPFVKSIQSPDGDMIDCVLFHHQPAFDLPGIRRSMPLVLPELPTGYIKTQSTYDIKQLWSSNGESCPNGTIPIRRTSESDMLRFSKFGKKLSTKSNEKKRYEKALAYVRAEQYYGARAKLNVWEPNVTKKDEFSLSQIWVIHELLNPVNTIEAGWINDGYQGSGCFNLLCSGFVQTNQNISLGAAILPVSTYNGTQYDIDIFIWKDPRSGNWWLCLGNDLIVSNLIGYWPSTLFTCLGDHANLVRFGGEVLNSQETSAHTSTQMGSGHFASEAFGKASFARNLQLVNKENHFFPVSNMTLFADRQECYNVQSGYSDAWANYIFFGGPGNNPNCL